MDVESVILRYLLSTARAIEANAELKKWHSMGPYWTECSFIIREKSSYTGERKSLFSD